MLDHHCSQRDIKHLDNGRSLLTQRTLALIRFSEAFISYFILSCWSNLAIGHGMNCIPTTSMSKLFVMSSFYTTSSTREWNLNWHPWCFWSTVKCQDGINAMNSLYVYNSNMLFLSSMSCSSKYGILLCIFFWKGQSTAFSVPDTPCYEALMNFCCWGSRSSKTYFLRHFYTILWMHGYWTSLIRRHDYAKWRITTCT